MLGSSVPLTEATEPETLLSISFFIVEKKIKIVFLGRRIPLKALYVTLPSHALNSTLRSIVTVTFDGR